jgi:hypothetical protein
MLNCKEYGSVELLYRYLPGGTAENHENLCQDNRRLDRNSQRVHSVIATITCWVLFHCSRDRPLLNALKHKDYCPLKCDTVQYGRKLPTIWRNIRLPFSGYKSKPPGGKGRK